MAKVDGGELVARIIRKKGALLFRDQWWVTCSRFSPIAQP